MIDDDDDVSQEPHIPELSQDVQALINNFSIKRAKNWRLLKRSSLLSASGLLLRSC